MAKKKQTTISYQVTITYKGDCHHKFSDWYDSKNPYNRRIDTKVNILNKETKEIELPKKKKKPIESIIFKKIVLKAIEKLGFTHVGFKQLLKNPETDQHLIPCHVRHRGRDQAIDIYLDYRSHQWVKYLNLAVYLRGDKIASSFGHWKNGTYCSKDFEVNLSDPEIITKLSSFLEKKIASLRDQR